jgi:adenylate kinase
MNTMHASPALLLVGPTGVGKTPLGEYAEAHGFCGKRCTHFDFGAALRRVDRGGNPVGALTADDVSFIHKVLTEGALLEDETFYIASELLKAHVATAELGPDDYVLLNGLPRHVGQARDVDAIVRVQRVLHLHCTPEVVHDRIVLNSGGDRAERIDDAPEAVARKLAIFEERTRPLVDHYRVLDIPVTDIEITTASNPATIWQQFETTPSR